mgnify:CR=1 FL=1
MNIAWVTHELVIDYRAREWCKLPYPNHPHGCPNYNHRATCPPEAPLIENFIDLSRPVLAVFCGFKLNEHIERMHQKHPDWSERQLKCVLYWQGSVNKRLRDLAKLYSYTYASSIYTLCPEAMGVNVIKTMKKVGLPIYPRPKDIVFKVGLIGQPSPQTVKQETAGALIE